MYLRSLTACCVCGLLLIVAAESGCRRRDPYMDGYVEILNAEKRDLEDQIYELESELEAAQDEIDSLKSRSPRAKSGTALPPRSKTDSAKPPVLEDSDLMPPMIDPGLPIEPMIELPPVPTPVPPAAKPPTKTLKPTTPDPSSEPTPATTPDLIPEPDLGPPADSDEIAPPKLPVEALPAPKSKTELPFRKKLPLDAEAIDPQVSELFINPFRTTGIDLDQHAGDDALRVMFEPRNAAGQFVPQSGEVSIVLLDPSKTGDAARIARWDLSKQRVGEGILDARPDRGIKLELPWPEKQPDNGKLTLFVRYTGSDGQTIEASSDVFVAVAGQLSQRWTPRKQ